MNLANLSQPFWSYEQPIKFCPVNNFFLRLTKCCQSTIPSAFMHHNILTERFRILACITDDVNFMQFTWYCEETKMRKFKELPGNENFELPKDPLKFTRDRHWILQRDSWILLTHQNYLINHFPHYSELTPVENFAPNAVSLSLVNS